MELLADPGSSMYIVHAHIVKCLYGIVKVLLLRGVGTVKTMMSTNVRPSAVT